MSQLDEAMELERSTAAIVANLERIKELWEEMPSENDVIELADLAGKIHTQLAGCREAWEQLPDGDQWEYMIEKASELSAAMPAEQ